jgi:hypothetical protein
MKLVAAAITGLLLGVAIGWLILPRPPRQRCFRVEHEATLVNVDGTQIGSLPVGSFVVGERELDPKGELGWWAYAPVHFGTESEAARFVVSANVAVGKIPMALNAVSRDEVVTPRPTPPTH